LRLRCYKQHREAELTEANKRDRLRRAGRSAVNQIPRSLVNFIVFTDEKLFPWLARPIARMTVCLAALALRRNKLLQLVCCVYAPYLQPFFNGVCRGVDSRNNARPHFIEPGVKADRSIIPGNPSDAKKLKTSARYSSTVFQHSAPAGPAHRARETVAGNLLMSATPDLLESCLFLQGSAAEELGCHGKF